MEVWVGGAAELRIPSCRGSARTVYPAPRRQHTSRCALHARQSPLAYGSLPHAINSWLRAHDEMPTAGAQLSARALGGAAVSSRNFGGPSTLGPGLVRAPKSAPIPVRWYGGTVSWHMARERRGARAHDTSSASAHDGDGVFLLARAGGAERHAACGRKRIRRRFLHGRCRMVAGASRRCFQRSVCDVTHPERAHSTLTTYLHVHATTTTQLQLPSYSATQYQSPVSARERATRHTTLGGWGL